MSEWNDKVIEELRANGGKRRAFGGAPLLILHTTGAKSGQERVSPLLYRERGDDLVDVRIVRRCARSTRRGSTTSSPTPTPPSRSAPRPAPVRARVADGGRARPALGVEQAGLPGLRRVRGEDRPRRSRW